MATGPASSAKAAPTNPPRVIPPPPPPPVGSAPPSNPPAAPVPSGAPQKSQASPLASGIAPAAKEKEDKITVAARELENVARQEFKARPFKLKNFNTISVKIQEILNTLSPNEKLRFLVSTAHTIDSLARDWERNRDTSLESHREVNQLYTSVLDGVLTAVLYATSIDDAQEKDVIDLLEQSYNYAHPLMKEDVKAHFAETLANEFSKVDPPENVLLHISHIVDHIKNLKPKP